MYRVSRLQWRRQRSGGAQHESASEGFSRRQVAEIGERREDHKGNRFGRRSRRFDRRDAGKSGSRRPPRRGRGAGSAHPQIRQMRTQRGRTTGQKMKRRDFLKTGAIVVAGTAAAITGLIPDVSADAVPAFTMLKPEEAETLLKVTRQIYPHKKLDDAAYWKVVKQLDTASQSD